MPRERRELPPDTREMRQYLMSPGRSESVSVGAQTGNHLGLPAVAASPEYPTTALSAVSPLARRAMSTMTEVLSMVRFSSDVRVT